VGWFLICIATTLTHTFVVANVAHGAGAILGALVGYAVTLPSRRLVLGAATGAIVYSEYGIHVWTPYRQPFGQSRLRRRQVGYDALVANRNEEAVRWLRDAVKLQPKVSAYWFDLGIAYHRLGKMLRR